MLEIKPEAGKIVFYGTFLLIFSVAMELYSRRRLGCLIRLVGGIFPMDYLSANNCNDKHSYYFMCPNDYATVVVIIGHLR